MGDRAALISLFIKEGVSDPKVMRRLYDDGGDTGDIKPAIIEASYPREREVLDLVNNSKADFVSRLADGNRLTIPDWKNKDNIATHKLSYAKDGDRWVIYPNVQNIDGKLYDFSDPQYGLDKGWAALDSALYSGDYVEVPSEADAIWFTESYKRHYPGFNKYKDGGDKNGDVDAISGADVPPVDVDPQKSKTSWFDWWYKFRNYQIDNLRKDNGKLLTSRNRFNNYFLNTVHNRINNVSEAYNDVYDTIDAPAFVNAASDDSTARKQILDIGRDYKSDDFNESAKIANLIYEGVYTPYYNNILYSVDNGRIPGNVMIHERTHALRDAPYYPTLGNNMLEYYKSGNFINSGEKVDAYLDDGSEIYSRLNEFRYVNNLNPSHTYSKDEISKFRKSGALKKYKLDRYTDDFVYFLLNGLAYSDESIPNKSGVNLAALGGLFNKYDGKTEKSQKMVRLGKDDYLVPEELKPSVVTADSNEEKITIPIDYFFPERDNLAYKVDTLRDVIRSMVDRDKKVMNNSLETLKNYNSAYRNHFISNPYYRDYVNYGYNMFDKGGKSDSSTGEIKEYNWTAFDTWAARHPQAMMRLRKAKTLIGDALALHPVLGIYDDIMDYINQKPQEERDLRDEINSISTALGFSGKAFNSLYGKPVKKIFNDSEWTDAVKKVSNILNIPDKINDSIKFIDDFSRPVNEFDEGGDTELRDTINPSVVSAVREGMSKRQIRKNSRIVRTVLGNLGEDGIYTPEQKKRMSEYIIRVQGGQAGPSLPRVIDMRKGLKYRNKTGVSGLERVLYSNEPIKEIIDSINSDHISYDPDGTKVIHGFSLYNYNGTLTGRDNKYDKDIVDSYINGSAPYDGSVYSGKYSFGPYKNYINRNYKGRDIKSYMFGEQTLPKDVIDRLDRYSYERGDNSLVVSANTDDGVPFDINGKSYDVDFDAGGHLWQFIKDDDGTYYVRQSDSYDFEPNQYKKSYGNMPYVGEALSALDDVGNPVLVFNPWKVATRDDLYNITNGSVDVNEVSDDAIKKAIEHNRQKSNGKFLNAIDNALTFVYGVTR